MSLRLGDRALASVKLGDRAIGKICLGDRVIWTPGGIRDDFNRADGTLGDNWAELTSTPFTRGNIVQGTARLAGMPLLTIVPNTVSAFRWKPAVTAASDGYIETRAATRGDAQFYFDYPTDILGQANNSGGYLDGVGYSYCRGSQLVIVSRINGTRTERTACGSFAAGDVHRMTHKGTVHSLYANGKYVGGWDDGGTTSHAADHRSVVMAFSGDQAPYSPGRYSAAIDYLEAA